MGLRGALVRAPLVCLLIAGGVPPAKADLIPLPAAPEEWREHPTPLPEPPPEKSPEWDPTAALALALVLAALATVLRQGGRSGLARGELGVDVR